MSSPSAFSDLALGTDIVDIRRIQNAYEQFGMRFFQKLLTEQELAYCAPKGSEKVTHDFEIRRFIRRAASRIAAKEATAKALQVGMRGLSQAGQVRWKDIEVQTAQVTQGPQIRLYNRAHELATEQGITRWKLSLTHDGGVALATVIGLVECT